MKRTLLTLVALICVTVLSSCQKDEQTPANQIIGKWNVTDFNASGDWETVKPGYMYAEFKADNTYYAKDDANLISGTWKRDADIVTCNVSGAYVTYTIINLNGNKGTFEVKEPGYKPYSVKATRE